MLQRFPIPSPLASVSLIKRVFLDLKTTEPLWADAETIRSFPESHENVEREGSEKCHSTLDPIT
jgi:hypothetical protein